MKEKPDLVVEKHEPLEPAAEVTQERLAELVEAALEILEIKVDVELRST